MQPSIARGRWTAIFPPLVLLGAALVAIGLVQAPGFLDMWAIMGKAGSMFMFSALVF